jgi:hypothetical protein
LKINGLLEEMEQPIIKKKVLDVDDKSNVRPR